MWAKGASTPERDFEAYLEENREHLAWWYKNGDSGREHFAVPYRDWSGEKALFYVDFVIKAKSGTVYLFDTKTKDPMWMLRRNTTRSWTSCRRKARNAGAR